MVDPQDTHIGAATLTTLFDGLGGGIEDGGEGERTRGHTLGRLDRRIFGPQPGEGIAGAAAGLVNQGAVSNGGENAVHRVLNRQDKAGRKLAQIGTGVHQTGRIG